MSAFPELFYYILTFAVGVPRSKFRFDGTLVHVQLVHKNIDGTVLLSMSLSAQRKTRH